jgi:hypothetical protein
MRKQIKISQNQSEAIKWLHTPTESNEIREVLFGGAKNGGKSFLGAIYENTLCMSSQFEDLAFFIARHTRKDLIDYTIPTLYKFYKENGMNLNDFAKYNGQTNTFHFRNKSRIHLIDTAYTPSDPMYERFGSMEMTGGWIEEGGEHHELAYEGLKLSIGRQHNDEYNIVKSLLITCNPKKNWMYRDFYIPFKKEILSPNKIFFKSLVTENPFRAKGSEKILEGIKSKRDLMRLRYGEWEYDDEDNVLCKYDKILDIFTNSFVKGGQNFLSADIAITNDSFVIIAWNGDIIKEIYCTKNISRTDTTNVGGEVINKIDFTPLIDAFNRLAKKYNVPRSNIVYDADGIGHHMTKYLPGAVPLHNGSLAIHKEYANLKTELYYRMCEAINTDELFIEQSLDLDLKERLIEEIQCIKDASDIDGKMKITAKSEIKKIIGHSPDLTDAIAYRYLFKISRGT